MDLRTSRLQTKKAELTFIQFSIALQAFAILYSIILDRGHGIILYQAAKSLHDIDSCLCGSSRCLQWCF